MTGDWQNASAAEGGDERGAPEPQPEGPAPAGEEALDRSAEGRRHPGDDRPAGERTFADLTLWEALALGLRAPRATWRAFWDTIEPQGGEAALPRAEPMERGEPLRGRGVPTLSAAGAGGYAESLGAWWAQLVAAQGSARLVCLALMGGGFLLALLGSALLVSGENRTEQVELAAGAPWLLAGFLLWLAAGMVWHRDALLAWWQQRPSVAASEEAAAGRAADLEAEIERRVQAARQRLAPLDWAQAHAARLALAALGILLSLAAFVFNSNNTFTSFGVFVWVSSVVVWLAVLAPPEFDLALWVEARRAQWTNLLRSGLRVRLSWTALALVGIMALAAYLRLANLAAVPPEMTSDHVEKLLDAQRVLDGTHQVFFPNNGGREGLQMYLVAVFSQLSGLGMQFITLKWVAVLEGLLTIPVLWWMGRELMGEEERGLGNAVGLALAALVAVSYWHVALSRLALRIVLTPLIMALVMVYLARGMRHNRRADFLKAGLALGVGLYCYQAVRMIPVVIALGVGLAFLFRARTRADRRRYVANLLALVLVAGAIFVPLGRFMLEFPNLFWMRTEGRILGDDVIIETDPETGALVERDATLQDRLNALQANLSVLGTNIRNALLMFNWKGDVAWINGVPNEPAMDPFSGSLLILGLAAWLERMVRRRDMVDWLILPAIFIMLLPSALSIAFPVENPSATRTSGALPLVYLVAAYGLVFPLCRLEQVFAGQRTRAVSAALATALALGAFGYNHNLYFGEYVERYRIASLPYTVAGRVLRGFAESDGSYGNAFMVAYPYWFDHRAIGIEGGRIDWPNGLIALEDLPQKIRDNMGTAYAFDPDRAVLFFYTIRDEETPEVLQRWFPAGHSVLHTTGMEVKDFYTYIAPPPGEEWLHAFLAEDATEGQE